MFIITAKQREEFMDILRAYTFNDIARAIQGSANYLAALGLSTYTENLGGLYCGDLQTAMGKHYTSFIKKYFPQSYMQVDSQLQASQKGNLYKVVRCGLVHEYFMKVSSSVIIGGSSQPTCGILYNPSKQPSLEFDVNKYFDDFKKAYNDYYDDVIGTAVKSPDITLQASFDAAINGMPESPFSSSSGLTRESGGGGSTTKIHGGGTQI
jgi:hypothetical protein